jgi:hypothetical protein
MQCHVFALYYLCGKEDLGRYEVGAVYGLLSLEQFIYICTK